jgi:hypothetical protein
MQVQRAFNKQSKRRQRIRREFWQLCDRVQGPHSQVGVEPAQPECLLASLAGGQRPHVSCKLQHSYLNMAVLLKQLWHLQHGLLTVPCQLMH